MKHWDNVGKRCLNDVYNCNVSFCNIALMLYHNVCFTLSIWHWLMVRWRFYNWPKLIQPWANVNIGCVTAGSILIWTVINQFQMPIHPVLINDNKKWKTLIWCGNYHLFHALAFIVNYKCPQACVIFIGINISVCKLLFRAHIKSITLFDIFICVFLLYPFW